VHPNGGTPESKESMNAPVERMESRPKMEPGASYSYISSSENIFNRFSLWSHKKERNQGFKSNRCMTLSVENDEMQDVVGTDLENFSDELDCTLCHEYEDETYPTYKACDATGSQGGLIAFGGKGSKICEIRRLSDDVKVELPHEGHVYALRFSPDGKYLATGSRGSRNVRVWNVETGKEQSFHEIKGFEVCTVSWSNCGRFVASGDNVGKIEMWNVFPYESEQIGPYEFVTGFSGVCLSSSFSDDDKWFGCGGEVANSENDNRGYVVIFKYDSLCKGELKPKFTPVLKLDLDSFVRTFSFSPACGKNKNFVHGGGDRSVTIRDIRSGAILQQFKCDAKVNSCSFSYDGKYLAVGTEASGLKNSENRDGPLVVRDVVSGAILHRYQDNCGTRACCFVPNNDSPALLANGQENNADFVEFYHPLKLVSVGVKSLGVVKVRNLRTGIVKQTFKEEKDLYDFFFSPDGKYVASCGSCNETTIRHLKTGKTIKTLEGDKADKRMNACAFSPDSKKFALGSDSKKVQIFDVQSWQVLKTFMIESRVSILCFLDETQLVIGGTGKDLTLYNIENNDQKIYIHDVPVNNAWSICPENGKVLCGNQFKRKNKPLVPLALIDLQGPSGPQKNM